MQTIFEVTDDDGSVSYLHMGDAPEHDKNNNISHLGERFGHACFKQNKAIAWPKPVWHSADLFPLFSKANPYASPMFKGTE